MRITAFSIAVVSSLFFSNAVPCIAAPINFPSGYVPFAYIYSQSAPDAGGYSIVEGMVDNSSVNHGAGELYQYLHSLPVPSLNQQYADLSIELAPGQFFSNILVPTPAEAQGDFSQVDIQIINPYGGVIPDNIIPMSLFGTPFVFVIGPASAASSVPEPSAFLLLGLGLAGLAFRPRAR